MELMRFTPDDFAQMDQLYRRNLVNCLSGFKSLNLVGTINLQGVTNVAPFSQVFHIGANPALMGMLVRPDTVPRHTLSNLVETQFFTFNHVRESFYQAAHQTAARYEGSEFEATGLTPEFSPTHPAPYVQEAHIKIGLKFAEKHPLAINGTILVIGTIVEVWVPAACLKPDGFIDLAAAGTICSTGLDAYYNAQPIARLAYAKPDKPVAKLKEED